MRLRADEGKWDAVVGDRTDRLVLVIVNRDTDEHQAISAGGAMRDREAIGRGRTGGCVTVDGQAAAAATTTATGRGHGPAVVIAGIAVAIALGRGLGCVARCRIIHGGDEIRAGEIL